MPKTGSPALDRAIAAIQPLDGEAMDATRARLHQLTKPAGSLGRLEKLAIQLAGVAGDARTTVRPRSVVVMAADHGVAARGVSAYPQAVTAQMVANFLAGGAAINVLARHATASVTIVDIGVASDVTPPAHLPEGIRFVRAKVGQGTSDMTVAPAMTRAAAIAAIEVGLKVVAGEIGLGARLIVLGEMGIGNTTSASALTAVLTNRPARDVTGRGTGVDDETLAKKIRAIDDVVAGRVVGPDDPIAVLSTLGGFEIAGLVGVLVGAAAAKVPVILDGFITGAAALVAAALCPTVAPRLIASHRSVEPGHGVILEHLGLDPLLELELRLGEGTGAVLALNLIDAAVAIRDEMATFGAAGVSGPS